MSKVGWLAAAGAMWLAGCGPTCGETCFRMFDASACNVQPGGQTAAQLIESCRADCNSALETVGGMLTYDPTEAQLGGFMLSNETQAAAWMECVWSYDDAECRTDLQGGCYPDSF